MPLGNHCDIHCSRAWLRLSASAVQSFGFPCSALVQSKIPRGPPWPRTALSESLVWLVNPFRIKQLCPCRAMNSATPLLSHALARRGNKSCSARSKPSIIGGCQDVSVGVSVTESVSALLSSSKGGAGQLPVQGCDHHGLFGEFIRREV